MQNYVFILSMVQLMHNYAANYSASAADGNLALPVLNQLVLLPSLSLQILLILLDFYAVFSGEAFLVSLSSSFLNIQYKKFCEKLQNYSLNFLITFDQITMLAAPLFSFGCKKFNCNEFTWKDKFYFLLCTEK